MEWPEVQVFPGEWYQDPRKWDRAIDIASEFAERLQPDGLWAFNRYENCLKIRFDLEERRKGELKEIAESMAKGEFVERYRLDDWGPPQLVRTSHALGSKASIRFRNQAQQRRSVEDLMSLEELQKLSEQDQARDYSAAFYCLTVALLSELGFRHRNVWGFARRSHVPNRKLESVAERCITVGMVKRVQEIDDSDLASFAERFVHTVLNCIGRQGVPLERGENPRSLPIERQVIGHLQVSSVWNQIADSYKIPR